MEKVAVGIFGLACLWVCADGLLSPKGVNYEVQALMGIKNSLGDPHGILEDWDANAVDPCSWNMVTCSLDNLVVSLGIPSQNLSGTLSSSIGNLTNLQTVNSNRAVDYLVRAEDTRPTIQSIQDSVFISLIENDNLE